MLTFSNFVCIFFIELALILNLHLPFSATIVQEFSTFWLNQQSESLQIVSSDENSTPNGEISTSTVSTTEADENNLNAIYDDCGRSKTCFGLPENCLNTKSCSQFGAVIVKNETFTFELQSSSKLIILGFVFRFCHELIDC